MSGIALGQIIGIPLGTFLAEELGFKFPFVIFGVVMFLNFFLILIFVPQPNVKLQKSKITFTSTFVKYKNLLKDKDIIAVAISYLLMFLSLSIFIIYLSSWLELEFNATVSELGGFFAGGVMNLIAGPKAGKISDRLGRKKLLFGLVLD